jgi:CubicO group peptidase (beta-lactamase class C family)
MRVDPRHSAISAFLRECISQGDVPAAVAAVTNPQETFYIDAFGKSDVAGNVNASTDTIFRIASMTKPVTSLAAMLLIEDGKIQLTDPIAAHLQDYRDPMVLSGNKLQPPRRPICVRDLLTNTSGICYPYFQPALREMLEGGTPVDALPLVHDPGEQWTYGPGTALLARLVAAVSGGTIDTFCRERIFDPLQMEDTAYSVPAEKRHRVATIHERNIAGTLIEKSNPPTIQSRGRGDDGLFSTAGDYAAFTRFFLNTESQAIRSMMSNQIGDLSLQPVVATKSSVARPFPTNAGKDKFGFGFQIEMEPSQPGMRPPGSLSWTGIFNSYFWIDSQREIGGVLLMQLLPGMDEKAFRIFQGFERLIYSCT